MLLLIFLGRKGKIFPNDKTKYPRSFKYNPHTEILEITVSQTQFLLEIQVKLKKKKYERFRKTISEVDKCV